MNAWEKWLNDFLPSIYDNPKGYSLRDLDDSAEADVGCVSRARLNCYAIENLLLTNECFATYGLNASTYQTQINEWVAQRPTHPASASLKSLSDRFDDRRTTKIKDIRNVLVALLGASKPWEVLVGQLLADHAKGTDSSKHSVREYLGPGVISKLLS